MNDHQNISVAAIPDWVTRVVSRVSASEGKTDCLNLNRDGNGLSYGIIQEHGGTIEVESPVIGPDNTRIPGTLFRLLLPFAGETAAVRD